MSTRARARRPPAARVSSGSVCRSVAHVRLQLPTYAAGERPFPLSALASHAAGGPLSLSESRIYFTLLYFTRLLHYITHYYINGCVVFVKSLSET